MKNIFVCLIVFCASVSFGQDSVDVTFRYNIDGFPSGLSVPGQFNAWNNTAWPMTYQGGNLWIRNARLAVGGAPSPIPGAFQYKFYYTGASPWPNDPLNHHVNPSDNDNSFIIVKNPTIYHFLPNQRTGTVSVARPTITAYIFPRVGTTFDTSQLALTIDGTTITGMGSAYNFTAKQMSYPLQSDLANGGHTVILRAGTTLDTVSFVVQVGGPTLLPMPSYAKHGVTLPTVASNDSTTFRLRVGATNFVALRIAPLGQPVAGQQPTLMRKNPTTDDWWVNVALPAGSYEYQYQTGSGNPINDPWGKWNGTYGTRFTIGPAGLTADDYVWRSTNYQRPPLNKSVMYEMNLGEFVGGYYGLPGGQGTFAHLTSALPYLDSLGINAIELMPINDYGLIGRSGFSWGYDVSHHFALEPGYGTPRDFKVLVDSAHARGIAIVLDVVFNHLNDPGPLWQMQPSEATSPYFKLCTERRFNEDDLCFFRDMDHWTPETQEYILEVLKMWIDVYRVDGFRYDYTQGIGWNVNEPTKGILGWANKIDSLYQGRVYQIVEHLPESPALLFYSGITSGWHDSFRDEVFDEARFRNRSLTNIENLVLKLDAYQSNDFPAVPNVYGDRIEPINATVNHDEQSLIYEMISFQGVPLAEALQRDKLYGTLMFTSLGIPMLWEGMEFSAPRGWQNGGERLSYRPVEFNLYPTARGQSHYQYYKKLIFQRKRNPALHSGLFRLLLANSAQKTLAWGFEELATTARFIVVANFTGAQQTITSIPWLGSGTFYDAFDQSTLVVNGGNVPSMTIPAYTAKCYSSIPDNLLLDVKATTSEVPTEYSLSQNYPNPFNPSTKIKFSIPSVGTGHAPSLLKVYDVLGREVATLANENLAAGTYQVQFDARTVSSGMYFYRLQSGGFVETKKMVVAK
jgi:1,4-alpha-glucan branching enzyme